MLDNDPYLLEDEVSLLLSEYEVAIVRPVCFEVFEKVENLLLFVFECILVLFAAPSGRPSHFEFVAGTKAGNFCAVRLLLLLEAAFFCAFAYSSHALVEGSLSVKKLSTLELFFFVARCVDDAILPARSLRTTSRPSSTCDRLLDLLTRLGVKVWSDPYEESSGRILLSRLVSISKPVFSSITRSASGILLRTASFGIRRGVPSKEAIVAAAIMSVLCRSLSQHGPRLEVFDFRGR